MRTIRHMALVLVLVLLNVNIKDEAAAQRSGRTQPGTRTIIFKVLKVEKGGYMEPIVILERGRYKAPIPPEMKEASFNSTYFRPGQSYRMLFGGGEAGRATVVKPAAMGCAEWGAADVRMQSTVKLLSEQTSVGAETALATSSNSLGRTRSSNSSSARRAPSSAEQKTALTMARDIFRRNRVPASLLPKVGIDKLVATDLDNDGRTELIGNFYIGASRAEGVADYTLLLLLEPRGGGAYRVGLARYFRITEKYRQVEEQGEDYLDQLDLDGDGVDEILVQSHYWEAWSYKIYKRQRGAWRRVYWGGGSGC